MIFTTASEMIQAAFESIGVQDPDEAMSAGDGATGLRTLNLLFDEMSIDRGKVFIRTEDIFALTTGDDAYTIGAGADIDTVLPISIEQAFLRDTSITPNIDRPLRVKTSQAEYNILPYKGQSNLPSFLYFTGGSEPATIYFDYAPDKAYELHLFSHKAFTKLADINTQVVLPDGYEAWLTAHLGIRLCPIYDRNVPDVVANVAAKLDKLIDNKNLELPPKWQDVSQPPTMNWGRGGGAAGTKSDGWLK